MTRRISRLLVRLNAIAVLIAVDFAVVSLVDQHMERLEDASSRAPALPFDLADALLENAVTPDRAGDAGSTDDERVFVLFFDSLRYESAVDPDLMPRLHALMERSVYAKVQPARDAVTLPAMRAAFTGRTHLRVLSFVDNFIVRTDETPSLFSELEALGRSAAIYSDPVSFHQFRRHIETYETNEGVGRSDVERQNRRALEVCRAHLRSKHALTLIHLNYIDHVAHRFHVSSKRYRAASNSADRLIQRLEALIPASQTFVVFGDHGHTEDGRHAMGLEVPTFILARGPRLGKGVDLGHIDISAFHRLLSVGLGLSGEPLDATHPQAPSGDADSLAAAAAGTEGVRTDGIGRFRFLSMALFVGVVLGLWWLCLRNQEETGRISHLHTGAIWLLLLGGAVADFSTPSLLAGLVLGGYAALHGSHGRQVSTRSFFLAAVLVAAAASLAWGSVLAQLRAAVHWPSYSQMSTLWLVYFGICGAVARRWGAAGGSWLLLAGPALLFYPTVYHYGFAGALGPAWCGWALLVLAQAIYRHRGSPRRASAEPLLLSLGVLVLVLPYFYTYADNFEFEHFVPLIAIPQALSKIAAPLAILASSLILYLKRGQDWKLRALAVALAAWTAQLAFGALQLHQSVVLAVSAVFGLSALLVPRLSMWRASRELRKLLGIAAAFSIYTYSVRVPCDRYQMALTLLAASVLSIRLVHSAAPTEREISAHYAFLLAIGVLFSGWTTLSWGVRDLEWAFAYDYFAADTVYYALLAFLPWMLLRYCVPLAILYLLIHSELPQGSQAPSRFLYGVVGIKVGSLMLIQLGLGGYYPSSTVYLEAVYQTAILITLCIALILHPAPRALEERPPPSGRRWAAGRVLKNALG